MLETDFSSIPQTQEMFIADQLKPLKPSIYQQIAKDLMHKYHLDIELPVSGREANKLISYNN